MARHGSWILESGIRVKLQGWSSFSALWFAANQLYAACLAAPSTPWITWGRDNFGRTTGRLFSGLYVGSSVGDPSLFGTSATEVFFCVKRLAGFRLAAWLLTKGVLDFDSLANRFHSWLGYPNLEVVLVELGSDMAFRMLPLSDMFNELNSCLCCFCHMGACALFIPSLFPNEKRCITILETLEVQEVLPMFSWKTLLWNKQSWWFQLSWEYWGFPVWQCLFTGG